MKHIFPITTHVVEDDLTGNKWDVDDCRGARALKRVVRDKLPNHDRIIWSDDTGFIGNTHVYSSIPMMACKEGDEVTFTLTRSEQIIP